MKLIQHSNGVVVDIINVRNDMMIENIILTNDIPDFEPRDGYSGVLKYKDGHLYWDYEEIVISDEISSDELQSMIEEVM